MRIGRRLIALCAAALVLAPASIGSAQGASPQAVLIDQLLSEIQIALAKTQKELTNQSMPPLDSVTLSLVAEAQKEGGGKINLYIVSFGKKWERQRSQEIELTLKPPSALQPLNVAAGPSVADQLVSAIVNAARGVQNARNNKQVPLVSSTVKIVLSFVVKGATSAGLKFEIAPITADLSGSLADSAIQKITLTFQNAKK